MNSNRPKTETTGAAAPPDDDVPMEADGDGTPVCYLIVDEYTRPGNPAGILRRATAPDGEITSEKAFRRNLTWHDVTGHYPVPGTDRDLFEIPHDEAARVIAAMHLAAARADDLPEEEPPVTAAGKPTVHDLGIDADAEDWARSGEGPGCIEITFPLPPDGREGEWERGDWVLMRVTADPERLILIFDRNEWACFLDGAGKGEFNPAATE